MKTKFLKQQGAVFRLIDGDGREIVLVDDVRFLSGKVRLRSPIHGVEASVALLSLRRHMDILKGSYVDWQMGEDFPVRFVSDDRRMELEACSTPNRCDWVFRTGSGTDAVAVSVSTSPDQVLSWMDFVQEIIRNFG